MATGNCRHDPSRRKRRRSEACNDQVYLGKINDSAGRVETPGTEIDGVREQGRPITDRLSIRLASISTRFLI